MLGIVCQGSFLRQGHRSVAGGVAPTVTSIGVKLKAAEGVRDGQAEVRAFSLIYCMLLNILARKGKGP
jgi:hypothetical protein